MTDHHETQHEQNNAHSNDYKQLLDEVFVISRIIKVEVRVIDNPYRDLDYSGYHKNLIIVLLYIE